MTASASVTTATRRPAGDHPRRRPVRVLAVMVLLSHAGLNRVGPGRPREASLAWRRETWLRRRGEVGSCRGLAHGWPGS